MTMMPLQCDVPGSWYICGTASVPTWQKTIRDKGGILGVIDTLTSINFIRHFLTLKGM